MSEFNERTALNYKLRQDAEATERRAQEARDRKLFRALSRAYRKAVRTVALDAALIGSGLTAVVAAVTCLICWGL